MKELIETIACALVDDPDQVEVTEIEGAQATVLELHVALDDVGKVIGKRGATARAMRTLLSVSERKTGERVLLEILD